MEYNWVWEQKKVGNKDAENLLERQKNVIYLASNNARVVTGLNVEKESE